MTDLLIRDTPPAVFIIGVTNPDHDGMDQYLRYRNLNWKSPSAQTHAGPAAIIEMAGRVCYESFHNPKDTNPITYILETAIRKDHGSILEHVNINFMIAGLPRTTLLELERHRAGTAFSFRSTRYVDNWLEFVIPPAARESLEDRREFTEAAVDDFDRYIRTLDRLKTQGLKKKQRTEAARELLGGNLAADGVFTCNIRALLHILKLRLDPGAGASIQEFAHNMMSAASNRELIFHDLIAEVLQQNDPEED